MLYSTSSLFNVQGTKEVVKQPEPLKFEMKGASGAENTEEASTKQNKKPKAVPYTKQEQACMKHCQLSVSKVKLL